MSNILLMIAASIIGSGISILLWPPPRIAYMLIAPGYDRTVAVYSSQRRAAWVARMRNTTHPGWEVHPVRLNPREVP